MAKKIDLSPQKDHLDPFTIMLILLAANGALFLMPLLLSITAPLLATEIIWLFGEKKEIIGFALIANFIGVLALSFYFLLWLFELLLPHLAKPKN